MNVNPQQLLDDGFIILRQVISPEQLGPMRDSYDVLVERRGGDAWLDSGAQPRLEANALIDESTANAVEIWLHENTIGVTRQLLCVPEPTVQSMWCMCSPLRDHGPHGWHRDIHPIDMAPLRVLQDSLLSNGPVYVQWNIALYDDDVLWVVPGSHRRFNTEAENGCLRENPLAPLPGGTPVKLKAGDGVVYSNYLLHWGSNYSRKLRRTLHGGHTIFPYYPDLSFTRFLSSNARRMFEQWDEQSVSKQDATESALRAILSRDETAYRLALGVLQPGADDNAQLMLTVYLCKAVYAMWILHHPGAENVPEQAKMRASDTHATALHWGPPYADRFVTSDVEALWNRFGPLEAKLKADTPQLVPGFQDGTIPYYFEDLADPYSVDAFIATWNA